VFRTSGKLNPGGGRGRWPGRELARALRPLGDRIFARYWVESLRLALLWGLAVSCAALALSWLYPLYPPAAALLAGGAAVPVVAALRFHRRPDALAVVRVADLLGAGGAAVTAYRLLEAGATDAWSRAAAAGGISACAGINADQPGVYPVIPRWLPWRDVALLAALLLVMLLVPNPLGSYWANVKEEREALAAAAAKTKATVERVRNLKVNGENVLPEQVRKELAGLPREVKNAGDRREAADRLERARWRLDEAQAVIGTPAQRDLSRLAAAWGSMNGKEWHKLAGALQKGSRDDIQKAVRDLTGALQKAGAEERKQIAGALFSSAAAVDDPALRRALQEAAGAALGGGNQAAGSAAGNGGSGPNGAEMAAAADALAGALAGLAEAAVAGNALGGASASLAALAGGLTGAGATGGTAVAVGSSGGSGAGNTSAGAGNGANSGNGNSPGSDGQGNGASGDGNGGSGNSGGKGNNGNSGTGNGGLGSGGPGAGRTGSGMDMVYTPFLPDAGGEETRVPGQVRQGERGSAIGLNRSPTTLGAVRPYTEVYGRYLAEAHDSLSRAPLPPDMENLVWRYFNALNQEEGEK
jgi:hypothetical protein